MNKSSSCGAGRRSVNGMKHERKLPSGGTGSMKPVKRVTAVKVK